MYKKLCFSSHITANRDGRKNDWFLRANISTRQNNLVTVARAAFFAAQSHELLHGPNGVKPCYASISTLSILHDEPTLDTHSLKMHNFEICQKNMSKTLMIFFSHSCVTGKNCSISQRYAQGGHLFTAKVRLSGDL